MSHTVFNLLALSVLSALLGGCGLTQTVTDTSTSAARAIFYKQVRTLQLDIVSRAALNKDMADMTALAVPTLVRVYQLRDNKLIDEATYANVLNNADNLLRSDLLDQYSAVIKPGEGAQLDVPLHKDAQFVTVVAFYRTPDTQESTWRLTLPRQDLEPDRARVVELGHNQLILRPLAKE